MTFGRFFNPIDLAIGTLQACMLYPQLRGHIDYVDIGSPVTNKHYIAQPHGEIYGLDHSLERFDLGVDTRLRPETDVPGLYMTGQGWDPVLS